MRICSVEGCENKHYGLGYCCKHYEQFKRYGCIPERTKFDKNEIIECEDCAEIILYDKQNNEIARALIDLEYVDLVKDYKWYLNAGNEYARNDQVGYLHRFIMKPADDMIVDHINHNKLDNRCDNLRICTQQENAQNISIRSDNTSGVTGVTWDKSRGKWAAYIHVNNKKKFLGRFKTKKEAIEMRRLAEIEYYGEFAPTNN